MLQYLCDWCQRARRPGEEWILGFAAELSGAVSECREITIADTWSEKWAGHPLAVHFCCEAHKQNYVRVLFRMLEAQDAPASARRLKRRKSGSTDADSATAVATKSHARTGSSRRRTRVASPAFTDDDTVRAHGLGISLQVLPEEGKH